MFEFFSESKFEDFYEENDDCITVSTIHKAKGREFDNVYLLLSDAYPINDEEKRKIYVGLTRAKNQLHIHCNFSLFDINHQNRDIRRVDATDTTRLGNGFRTNFR